MAEDGLDEWRVRANDAMNVSLVTKAEQGPPKVIASFHPTWTYPIVEDPETTHEETSETIYGYKGLKINLRFNASDMRPHLSHTSSKRVPDAVATEEPPEINELFERFLPPVAFGKKSDFDLAVQNTPDDWHPPGELIESYDGDTEGPYEVWKGSLADPLVLGLVNRIQILVSLLIEGGTPIQTEPTEEREADPLDRWTVYFLYQKRPRAEEPGKFTYVFAGYSTVYRYFIFRPQEIATTGDLELPEGSKPFADFPCRSRISQFLILAPFQHKGNGQRLYNPIYKTLLADPMTFEITVEDPNEAFDVLRDMADMAFLRQQPEFNDIKINTSVKIPETGSVPKNIINKKTLEAVRTKFKIAPRQFSRLVEMHLMSKLPDSVRTSMDDMDGASGGHNKGKKAATREEEHEYRLWKLITKSRIASQNKEQLSAVEPSERIEGLNKTLGSVELEYALLLSMFERRRAAKTEADSKKRKLDADEDEQPASGKKQRVEAAA